MPPRTSNSRKPHACVTNPSAYARLNCCWPMMHWPAKARRKMSPVAMRARRRVAARRRGVGAGSGFAGGTERRRSKNDAANYLLRHSQARSSLPDVSSEPSSTDAALCINDSYGFLEMLSDQAVKRSAFKMVLHLSLRRPPLPCDPNDGY